MKPIAKGRLYIYNFSTRYLASVTQMVEYETFNFRVPCSSHGRRTKQINYKGEEKMYTISIPFEGNLIQAEYNSRNIHIFNSYKVKRKRDMKRILMLIRCASFNRGIFYSRKEKSWIREWKAHNILYKLGIKKERTESVDLNENESILRRFGYFILSLFSWK